MIEIIRKEEKEMTEEELIEMIILRKEATERFWRQTGWESRSPCNAALATIDEIVFDIAARLAENLREDFKEKCRYGYRV